MPRQLDGSVCFVIWMQLLIDTPLIHSLPVDDKPKWIAASIFSRALIILKHQQIGLLMKTRHDDDLCATARVLLVVGRWAFEELWGDENKRWLKLAILNVKHERHANLTELGEIHLHRASPVCFRSKPPNTSLRCCKEAQQPAWRGSVPHQTINSYCRSVLRCQLCVFKSARGKRCAHCSGQRCQLVSIKIDCSHSARPSACIGCEAQHYYLN